MSKRRYALVVTVGVLVALAAAALPSAAQCAMCKTSLTNSPEGRSIGEQFNQAILVMIIAPYVILAAFAAVLCRRQLRAAWMGMGLAASRRLHRAGRR